MTVDATVEIVRSADGTSIVFKRGPGRDQRSSSSTPRWGYRGFGPMAPLAAALASSFAAITNDRRGQ